MEVRLAAGSRVGEELTSRARASCIVLHNRICGSCEVVKLRSWRSSSEVETRPGDPSTLFWNFQAHLEVVHSACVNGGETGERDELRIKTLLACRRSTTLTALVLSLAQLPSLPNISFARSYMCAAQAHESPRPRPCLLYLVLWSFG